MNTQPSEAEQELWKTFFDTFRDEVPEFAASEADRLLAKARECYGPGGRGQSMKALSIRQPWAWLICHAGKDIENRDWSTRFRGPLMIHAGKTMTKDDYFSCTLFIADMKRSWRLPAYDILRKECGGIVGQALITDCVTESDSPWFCGPYGFVISKAVPLEFTPLKGTLSFFDVDETIVGNCRVQAVGSLL